MKVYITLVGLFACLGNVLAQPVAPISINFYNCFSGVGPVVPPNECGSITISNPGRDGGDDGITPPCSSSNCSGTCCGGRCVFTSCPPPQCIPNKTCEPPPDVCKQNPELKTCPIGTTEVGPDNACFLNGGCEGGGGNCYPKTCPFASAVIKCSNIYVFSPDAQMIACCSCPIKANSSTQISIGPGLLGNTLTRDVPRSGIIKVVSSGIDPFSGTCNPGFPLPEPVGVVAWATHWHSISVGPSTSVMGTETAFDRAPLSNAEQSLLTNSCQFIQSNGNGFGICSCGASLQPAVKP